MKDPLKQAMAYVDDNCLASAVCILMDENKRLRDELKIAADKLEDYVTCYADADEIERMRAVLNGEDTLKEGQAR